MLFVITYFWFYLVLYENKRLQYNMIVVLDNELYICNKEQIN